MLVAGFLARWRDWGWGGWGGWGRVGRLQPVPEGLLTLWTLPIAPPSFFRLLVPRLLHLPSLRQRRHLRVHLRALLLQLLPALVRLPEQDVADAVRA